ncbi:unnamed protein product [Blepharisma stoltei]|uniref:BZIP domain-containing protein n=1 Tax=Blepharisma stoltei TaxID=1481888 RepID=A0AAU9JBJ8_9CILI|nr:unnamed protein product [Blepharisma stoltei]
MENNLSDLIFNESEFLDFNWDNKSLTKPYEESNLPKCVLCGKFVFENDSDRGPYKRLKKSDIEISVPQPFLCENCLKLNNSELNSLRDISSKIKRLVKREQAKRKILKNPEIENPIPLEDNPKKQERQLKNRLAAQQSRDKHKIFVSNLIQENEQLKSENQKLQTIKAENSLLKKHLSQFFLKNNEISLFKKAAKGVTIALATIVSIMILANTLENTIENCMNLQKFNLDDYKDLSGKSVKDAANSMLFCFGIDLSAFLPCEERNINSELLSSQYFIENSNNDLHNTIFCPEAILLSDKNENSKQIKFIFPKDNFSSIIDIARKSPSPYVSMSVPTSHLIL